MNIFTKGSLERHCGEVTLLEFTYTFRPVGECDMCGSEPARHKVLGIRLNASQGKRPRHAGGVAVTVKKCRDCGLVFSDPRPIPQSITDHYELPAEDYFDASQRQIDPDYFADEIATAKRLLNIRSGMTALDVGVGLGKGMRALASAGFDTWGIEPSTSFYDWAVKTLSLDPARLQLATVEEATFPENHFDFIVFGAVLEHLHSPSLALSSVLKWLKPGGIVHAEVPSSSYLMSKVANLFFKLNLTTFVTHLSPMHAPFHLFEFTLDSFRKDGARSGYEVAWHGYKVGPIYHLPKLVHGPFERVMEKSNTGMQLTVFLRKPAVQSSQPL